MKNILLLTACMVAGLFSFAQGGKTIHDQNAQTRSVKGFHAIRISGGIDLYLNQGGDEAVAISAATTETRDRIRTEVENGVLNIYLESHGFHWGGENRKMKAYVSVRTLTGVTASGGSDVYIEDGIKSDKLDLTLSGGSDLRGKIDAGDLRIVQSGGSDSFINGSATQLSVNASGGSDFHGYELAVDNCRIDASGGSDAQVNVNKELNVSASGGSDVYYKGRGTVRESHSSGSSSIHRKD